MSATRIPWRQRIVRFLFAAPRIDYDPILDDPISLKAGATLYVEVCACQLNLYDKKVIILANV